MYSALGSFSVCDVCEVHLGSSEDGVQVSLVFCLPLWSVLKRVALNSDCNFPSGLEHFPMDAQWLVLWKYFLQVSGVLWGLFSLWCFATFSCLPLFIPLSLKMCWHLLVPFLYCGLEVLQAVSWGNYKSYLVFCHSGPSSFCSFKSSVLKTFVSFVLSIEHWTSGFFSLNYFLIYLFILLVFLLACISV